MINRLCTIAIAVVLLLAPMAAHEGHIHPVLGTISAVRGKQIDVVTRDGKTVTVSFDGKTRIVRGAAQATQADLKPGVRISVMPRGEKPPVMAEEIRVGSAKPAAVAPAHH